MGGTRFTASETGLTGEDDMTGRGTSRGMVAEPCSRGVHVIGEHARAWHENGMWHIRALLDGLEVEHVELWDVEARELAHLILKDMGESE
ncbi:hypothetical protein [Bifidobacterium sp. SO1]|uniref:hypothetical protein n=1 Tax=Bifidobacterium sp. SO1 TaxID=2809029 RepID=UPI001BDC8193|nr:hypothetical protein [Bifidobacterium sp. SO1]MBT1162795.1 hypothetical protein [Bifidobacterium sp. SO1]